MEPWHMDWHTNNTSKASGNKVDACFSLLSWVSWLEYILGTFDFFLVANRLLPLLEVIT
jgi:hypothetical protein